MRIGPAAFLPILLYLTMLGLLIHVQASPPSFKLEAYPETLNVTAGEVVSVNLNLVRLDPSFTGEVRLSASHKTPELVVSFTDNPLDPDVDNDTVVMISVWRYAKPGAYSVTIAGKDPASNEVSVVTVVLNVKPPFEAPGVEISVEPRIQEVIRGFRANFTLWVRVFEGVYGEISVDLRCLGCLDYDIDHSPACPSIRGGSCAGGDLHKFIATISTNGMGEGPVPVVFEVCTFAGCDRSSAVLVVKERPDPGEVVLRPSPSKIRALSGSTFSVSVISRFPRLPEPAYIELEVPKGWFVPKRFVRIVGNGTAHFTVTVPKSIPAGEYRLMSHFRFRGERLESVPIHVQVLEVREKEVTPELSLVIDPPITYLSIQRRSATVNLRASGVLEVAELSLLEAPEVLRVELPRRIGPNETKEMRIELIDERPGRYVVRIRATSESFHAVSEVEVVVEGAPEPVAETVTSTITETLTETTTVMVTKELPHKPDTIERVFPIALITVAVASSLITYLALRRRPAS